jgi:4,5-dihydroxyphthalate decarboxylase
VKLEASVTPLTFACGVYDRTVPLFTREVAIEGVDLTYVPIDDPRQIFDRMARGEGFDLAEMSLSEFICRHVADRNPFVALPIFPSRMFRHSFIAVNGKKIKTPTDLAGKRIGVPLYTMTAAVVIRGMLEHDHGVDLSKVHWVEGAINAATSHGDPTAMPLLAPVDIEDNHSGRSLSELLDAGEIDAIIGTSLPNAMKTNPDLVRLFPDFHAAERDFYTRTKIFPIMHTLVIQREIYDRDPSLGPRIYAAFEAAKTLSRKRLQRTATISYMLPWMIEQVEEIERVFDGDPWPYGVEPNRPTLEALVTYLAEQHMIAHEVPIEELFAPTR